MNEPLPDDLRDLLDAERDLDTPATPTRERLFARLAPLVLPPIGGAGGAPADASAGVGSTVGKAGAGAGVLAKSAWRGKLLLSVFSAAVGAGGGAAGHAWLAPPKAELVVVAAPTPTPPSDPATPVPSLSIERTPAIETAQAPAAPPSATTRPDERTHGAGSLRAERLLVETASAALTRGDYASAIASLRKHARTFPHGELAQEREVLLVQALKASGDDAAAQQRAKDFKQKFPGSLQQGTVDKASPE
jgi:Outer membrane lipoprotein